MDRMNGAENLNLLIEKILGYGTGSAGAKSGYGMDKADLEKQVQTTEKLALPIEARNHDLSSFEEMLNCKKDFHEMDNHSLSDPCSSGFVSGESDEHMHPFYEPEAIFAALIDEYRLFDPPFLNALKEYQVSLPF